MFFDTHCHVNFSAFDNDRDAVIKKSLEAKTWMVNVGTQFDTSKSAVELAAKNNNGVFAAIGLHPVHTYQQILDEEESHFQTRKEVFNDSEYEKLITEKVVAVGECGLDYFRLQKSEKEDAKKKQKDAFISQIVFAKKHKFPLIVHCRDAYEDVLEILKSEYDGHKGIIHSFTDTWETAQKFLNIGFFIALNGILTFDKSGKLAEVAKNVPFDRILIETDAPYLTPPPFRGKRNEPGHVQYVAGKIAEVRGSGLEEVSEQTFSNACKLFGIKNV